MIEGALDALRRNSPLVYCLTNFVTVNDCANIVLAAGASPVMSLDVREAAELAKAAQAVLINFGTPDTRAFEAMLAAGRAANGRGIPVLLDPVGAGATELRRRLAAELLAEIRFTAIRGNASEMRSLAGDAFDGRGVDAGGAVPDGELERTLTALAERTGAVIAASGPVDFIADGKRFARVFNGSPMMAKITGSGCMLGALTAAFLGGNPGRAFEAVLAATVAMGVCGEVAFARLREGEGSGSFRVRLIDAVSLLDEPSLCKEARYEVE